MSWTVTSRRMPWTWGDVLSADDLSGCNIGALVAGGHLVPVAVKPVGKRQPVKPVTNETADEPEEQH